MRAATAFWPKPQKAAKALFDLPAPSEKRRQRFSTAPNRLGGNLFLLMWLECARPLFTLTPAACAFPAQAGRGIIAQPKPRRRNCRRAISLAASTQVGEKRFLREKSRFRGEPRNAGQPFGRQGISSSVNAAGIPVGCRRSGEMMLPTHRQTYLQQTCGEVWPQNGIVHPVRGCVRPPPFGQSPKRRQKRFLISRRQAKNAVSVFRRRRTGWEEICFSSCGWSAQGRFLR